MRTYTDYNDRKIADVFMHSLRRRALGGALCSCMEGALGRLLKVDKLETPSPPPAQSLAWEGSFVLTKEAISFPRTYMHAAPNSVQSNIIGVRGITSTGIRRAVQI